MDSIPSPDVAPLQIRPPDAGDPAPFFAAATGDNPRYHIDAVAGRWIVLMVFGSLGHDESLAALELALRDRDIFNDTEAALFGVSVDPEDRDVRGIGNSEPGVRFFWDFDGAVSRLYGLASATHLTPAIFLIDPALRIVMAEAITHTDRVMDRLKAELRPGLDFETTAPVLILPRIFEPELCRELIACFDHGQSEPSGFSIDIDGRTVQRANPLFKRRRDVLIEDETLITTVRQRLETRLFPMVKRFLGWQAVHIERYLICRYDEVDQGFFFPHRDDVTLGTAHRHFAVSLNLNAEDHEGGDLRFPEFGRRLYRPPTGGAAVFCCNMLHEATPVTRGARYVVVPFLYDEADAAIRAANLTRLG